MFYDIFSGLCEMHSISKTKAAKEIGLSSATPTKWLRTGATPDGKTISKVSAYFNVEPNFLLGFTPDGYALETEYKLKRIKEEFEKEKDPNKKSELAYSIDVLQESLDDQRIVAMLTQNIKKPAPTEGDGLSDKDLRLIEWFRSLPPEKQKAILISQDAPEGLA